MMASVRAPASARRPRRTNSRPLLAIVGAGASGTLTAAHLLRAAPGQWRVVLIDRGSHGTGVAYSTRDPQHLVNVSANCMSAFDDDSDDLLRWCHTRGHAVGETDYIPRQLYGAYLQDLLVRFARPDSVDLLGGHVVAIDHDGEQSDFALELEDGERVVANAAVLAIGNPRPAPLAPTHANSRVIEDPWDPDALERAKHAARVVVVGSGLTSIDIAQTLTAASTVTQVIAVSRHGALPRAHLATKPTAIPPPVTLDEKSLGLEDLSRAIQTAVSVHPSQWRSVIDSLRPLTPDLWRGLSLDERRTFLRDLKWEWDIHRHRMAPPVAREINTLLTEGRFQVQRGTIAAVTTTSTAIIVHLDHDGERRDIVADWLINATGPASALSSAQDSLIQQLLADGLATPDALGIGIACDSTGALLSSHRGANARLFTLGPPRRGELLESTAIREIRAQAKAISSILISQHIAARR
jgi:uncharacterized NAD(P)/FAD-binding protein YdhS